MRVVLFTGKGGVGKTTTAAGTAALAAARGLKALVVSTDAAHSLQDTLGAGRDGVPALGPEPVEVAGGLFAQQVDARGRFERSWEEVQTYLLEVLDSVGVDPVEAEELTVLPGAEEVLALLEVRDQVRSDRWDLVAVDCAPTAETLRLLALPEALTRYAERVFPVERRLVRTLRPMLDRVVGVPLPRDRVLDAVQRLVADLRDVRALLTGSDASVRLVLTPEAVVVAEARRTLTSLALHGYRVDAVVANRVFPASVDDGWLAGWAKAQAERLREVEDSFAPLPVHRSPYRAVEPVGLEELLGVAELTYAGSDPLALPEVAAGISVSHDGECWVLQLPLPLARRTDLDLMRAGEDLVVCAGTDRRVIALPSFLRRCSVVGAAFEDDRLLVRFVPDQERGAR
ncbi:MAG TPA: ArsA family ATPase [Actinomycetes bacterium]|nr:ArsA family ATPase [Actinomycetes bacterium]